MNHQPSELAPALSVEHLEELIASYVNAYDLGLSRHENAAMEEMRRVARAYERRRQSNQY